MAGEKAAGPKIFGALCDIMADVGVIGKDKKNKQQDYNFRGIDDVYNELHSLMAKHRVFTTTEVLTEKREERPSKSGGVLIYSILTIKFTFYAEDGSFVESVVVGEGMDSGDKSVNKAMAVAHKYALLQIFCVPTSEPKDPEHDSPEPAGQAQGARPQSPAGDSGIVSQKQLGLLNFRMSKRVIDINKFLAYLVKNGYTSGPGFKEIRRDRFEEVLKLVDTRALKPTADPLNQDPDGPPPSQPPVPTEEEVDAMNVGDEELPF